MARTKTLILITALVCLISSVSASVMMEYWIILLDDLNMNNFKKLAMWQLWSTLGPLLGGVVKVAAVE